MRALCSRTSCSKSKGGALAWLFIAARASAGRCSTRLQRLNDRSWAKVSLRAKLTIAANSKKAGIDLIEAWARQ
jgi:hypothetical protein